MQESSPIEYIFGEYRLNVKGHQLWRGDKPISLTPKAYKTLFALVRRGEEMVTKDELLDEVWNDAFVEEGSLTQNISVLRKVFAPEKYIKTYPRLGYKFTAETEKVFEKVDAQTVSPIESQKQHSPTSIETPKKKIKWHLITIALVGILLLSSFSFWLSFKSDDNYLSSKTDLTKTSEAEIKSIAVLPLKDLNETLENKAFTLGFADNLISRLGKLDRFVVRPLSAVQDFNESGKSATIFGKSLKVDAVLVGTLQKDNERLRVNVQLINVENGQQLWSTKFDKSETDIFKLQDQLSTQVATILINEISKDESNNLTNRETDVFDAYQSYSKGLFFQRKRTSEDIVIAIKHFEKAIKLDEKYAQAYVGLADCYLLLSDSDFGDINPLEVKDKIEGLLKKALDLDPQLSEALTSMGMYEMNINWDLRASEKSYKQAIKINPKLSKAHHWYAWNLVAQKRFDEAETQMQMARELNPTSKIIASEMGIPMIFKGNYEKAIEYSKEAIEMDKNYSESRFQMWYAMHFSGNYEEAYRAIKAIKRLNDDEIDESGLVYLIIKGLTLSADGQKAEAFELYQQIYQKIKGGEYISPVFVAPLAFEVGEKDAAFELLNEGLKERNDYLLFLNVSPEFKNMRQDSRFQKLINEIGLS